MTKNLQRMGRWVAILVVTGTGWVSAQEGAKLGEFKIPEYTDEGVKKSELTGESAQVVGGSVEISGLTIEFFDTPTTNVKMKVSAPQCSYNRRGRIAKSPGSVNIQGENMVVTGKDFAWDGGKELFKIFSNAKVVISNVRERSGVDDPEPKGESDDQ